MTINPGKDPHDSVSPSYLNQTVPLMFFKNLEKSPTGLHPSTSETFKMIPSPSTPLKPAFGFSTTQNFKLGFQNILASFGSKDRVSVFLLIDCIDQSDRVAGAGKTILS